MIVGYVCFSLLLTTQSLRGSIKTELWLVVYVYSPVYAEEEDGEAGVVLVVTAKEIDSG
jgi:hypothetical protein